MSLKNTFLMALVLQSLCFSPAFAEGTEADAAVMLTDPLKALEIKSSAYTKSTETCELALTNHVEIVDKSEQFIASLVSKKSIDISAYEITMLQKIITNRFLHLIKIVNMYGDTETQTSCQPRLLGNAIAIYDFTQLGSRALKDSKLRRIILNFTNFPKYRLSKFKELYDHYTSSLVIDDLLIRLNEEKISLPEAMAINSSYSMRSGSFYALSDVAITGTTSIVSGATRVWGFISDQLKWRDGRLNKNIFALELVRGQLRPLDLIYEKRTFTLSNYTIPGHWGHVAVWLGTKEELIELGIWDKEYFAPFRSMVEEGKNIVELRKQGINYQGLSDFMNLDEIAVTRITDALNNAESIIKELTEQIDKKYDFTFNAQTSDKLTCAEFIAFSYGDIHWPETKALFQISVKPDDLAMLTLYKNSPSEFVLYLKGNKEEGSFDELDFNDWKKIFGKKALKELIYQ